MTGAYKNSFSLVIDNSFPDNIFFCLDACSPVKIPAKSQIRVIFKKGTRNIKVTKALDGSVVEHVTAAFDFERDYNIYNVGANNSYKIQFVSYTKE